ncbi:DUF3761 domain-containing protein [Undibacterium crateris]|uniref:DUF3761 domain-containing protein n=1 Tax=Undibacterium crateris TaxID=2528175 RepID=UPI0013899945|nr:DUF3761 domain-containing protein [Undibacterium crateris]NDI85483.1 DUF3761 domain-containing protein [Undibacterium crateris]
MNMRIISFFLAAIPATSLMLPAYAQLQPTILNQSTQKSDLEESKLSSHKHYINKAGRNIHSPSKSIDYKVPNGVSAKCVDGTYSFSKTHRGTCSHLGGVARWL